MNSPYLSLDISSLDQAPLEYEKSPVVPTCAPSAGLATIARGSPFLAVTLPVMTFFEARRSWNQEAGSSSLPPCCHSKIGSTLGHPRETSESEEPLCT
jgi:hypothetical protein